jgi:hypothetical protein
VFWAICKRFGGKISTLFAKVRFGTDMNKKQSYGFVGGSSYE